EALRSPQKIGGGGENCTPVCLLCRQMPCCLGYTASKLGAEDGTRTRGLDVGDVASLPLDDFRVYLRAPQPNAGCGTLPPHRAKTGFAGPPVLVFGRGERALTKGSLGSEQ